MTVVLNLVVMLGMLVVLPLGLRLLPDGPARLSTWWLLGAVPGALSLWLPRGWPATVPAAVYALVTVALAVVGAVRWLRRPSLAPRELAVLTALVAPSVAAISLVAERGGIQLLGFSPRVLSLTVAHFHFAGFVAALVAALVCLSTRDSVWAQVAAACVPAGILIVFAGFFTGRAVELAGTVVLTVGMWLVAGLLWRDRGPTGGARILFTIAAAVPVATMALALDWALGRLVGLPHLSINGMIATHGVANAVGFALCALLAWQWRKNVHRE